ncbi:MAG: caspase family protein, partial [Bacteroidota bacterium]
MEDLPEVDGSRSVTASEPILLIPPSETPGKRLFAVLIGINAYKNHPLGGCLNDVAAMETYLQEDFVQGEFEEVLPVVLRDQVATKSNVVTAIQQHLGQAQPGDSLLLYFSGHGAREKTEYDIFHQDELDNNIGGLLCATYERPSQTNLADAILSNKEIRYLLHPLTTAEDGSTKAHLVAIFDCCNSGSNTRSVSSPDLPAISRQVSRSPLPGRKLDQFLFSKDVALKQALEAGTKELDEVMPQGDHIMLAACREIELAWENPKAQRGAFSIALLDVLRAHKGQISYQELHTRVQNRMNFNLSNQEGSHGQTPQVYIRSRQLSDRYNLFLSNAANERPTYATVDYGADDNEWRLSVGAFHGIPMDQQQAQTQVEWYEKGKEKEAQSIGIRKVYPFYSILDLPSYKKPKSGKTMYRAKLPSLNLSIQRIWVDPSADATHKLSDFLAEKLEQAKDAAAIELVEQEGDADLVIQFMQPQKGVGKFELTRPGQIALPLIKRTGDKETLYQHLKQISRWTNLKNLERASVGVPDSLQDKTSMYPVEFRLYRWNEETKSERLLKPQDGRYVLDIEEGKKEAWIRFELVNHAPQLFHVSLPIMSEDFGFLVTDTKVMGNSVLVMQPPGDEKGEDVCRSIGTEQPIQGGEKRAFIDLGVNEYHREFNLPGESTFLKLLVSATPINQLDSFHMKKLGFPKKVGDWQADASP